MMRSKFVFSMLLFYLLSLHSFAFEYELPHENRTDYQYDMDIPWRAGHEAALGYQSGYWGFTYELDHRQDESKLQPYYNIEKSYARWNKTIRGPLVEGGQVVNTTIGARLGSFYTPYVAFMDDKLLGMRIHGFKWDAPKWCNLTFDGTYIFGHLSGSSLWKGPELIDGKGTYALNLKGNFIGMKVNNTVLHYYNNTKDRYFSNYSLEGEANFSRKMRLSGVYAGYQENTDWLYGLHYRWDIIPSFLRFESSLQDSEVKNLSVIRGPQNMYIMKPDDSRELDPLEEAAFLGRCFNIGPTVWAQIGPTKNMLKLNYATSAKTDFRSTAPIAVPQLPRFLVGLSTVYQNFIVQNTYYLLKTNQVARSFYKLGFVANPGYELPHNLNALIRLDFDFNSNYISTEEMRVFSLAGLRLYTNRDIWKFKKVELDSYWMLWLAGEDYDDVNPFKFTLMAKYNAPNGLKFRLQYFSSDDFKYQMLDIFGQDRYEPYRWYRNDLGKSGLRLVVAIPF